MIFDELYNKVNSVIDRLDEIMVEVMVEHEAEIIDLNLSQLEEGIDAEGQAIEPEYEYEEYAKLKKSMGSRAPFGTPDLKLEGDFHSGFYGEPYNTVNEGMSGLFVDSRDEKSEKLQRKYGLIFGIAPKNMPELQDILIEGSQKFIIDEITK